MISVIGGCTRSEYMFLISEAASHSVVDPPDIPAKEKLYLDTLARITAERSSSNTSNPHQILSPEKEEAKGSA